MIRIWHVTRLTRAAISARLREGAVEPLEIGRWFVLIFELVARRVIYRQQNRVATAAQPRCFDVRVIDRFEPQAFLPGPGDDLVIWPIDDVRWPDMKGTRLDRHDTPGAIVDDVMTGSA